MAQERSNVEHPLWRKKVDKSLFEYGGTTLPQWVCRMWDVDRLFKGISSRKSPNSSVNVVFRGRRFGGFVTVASRGRVNPAFRLWFEEPLVEMLKQVFSMSYIRSIEQQLSGTGIREIENRIPFWEFLDIEFDQKTKVFRMEASYTQTPQFPLLFSTLIGSPGLKKVADEVEGKEGERIYKQDWQRRDQLAFALGASNALYLLMDSKAKLLYVGEAKNLLARLLQPHVSIPGWDYYRYEVFPKSLEPHRRALERMLIRYLAALMPSRASVKMRPISSYTLTNTAIDK